MPCSRSSAWSLAALLLLARSAPAQFTTQVDVAANGAHANSTAHWEGGDVSDDGRFVAFASAATNLHPDAPGPFLNVFRHDRMNGQTVLVSVGWASSQTDGGSFEPSISADGSVVAFRGDASDLVPSDTNGTYDVFLRDLVQGTTILASVASDGTQASSGCTNPSLSGDGTLVAYYSRASNLVPGDTNNDFDVFVFNTLNLRTRRVSVSTSGGEAGGLSSDPAFSSDGRFVAFRSTAPNLVVGDTNGLTDIFVYELGTGSTTRVSLSWDSSEANGGSSSPTLSSNGQFVAFGSSATNLVAGDTNAWPDVFVRDLATGAVAVVSVDSFGTQANGSSVVSAISGDGNVVAFTSLASNLVDDDVNGKVDVFVRDLAAGTTLRASLSSNFVEANDHSDRPGPSFDGSVVVYISDADNLVAGDTNNLPDAFVHLPALTCPISAYCAAKTNSAGCHPSIASSGAPLFSGNDAFFLTASAVLPQKSGVMFWGPAPSSIPFGGGMLCVAPPFVRTAVMSSGGVLASPCSGVYSFHFRQSYMSAQGLQPGDVVYAQFWSRDPGFATPNDIGLTNAITFPIAP